MFFFERSACIEFLDQTKIKITTPFRQREFDLVKMEEEGKLFIDLIELKALSSLKNLKFYVFLNSIDDVTMERRYVVTAGAHGSTVGAVEFLDGFKVIKAKILYD